jgi:CheY-like chemotaxis protein
LIATTDDVRRTFLAFQLDADGHTVHEADHLAAVVAKLSVHAIDVLVLGDLQHPADRPRLLRAIRPVSVRGSIPASRSSPSAPTTR